MNNNSESDEPSQTEISAVMAAMAHRAKGIKKPSSAANMAKARAISHSTITREQRAEWCAKARAARAAKAAAKKVE